MMTFWEKVKIVTSNIWKFLEPFIKQFLSQAGMALADIAMREVEQLALTNWAPDEKRAEAFKRISKELQGRGIKLGASVIYAAIEAAVQNLKSN